MSETAGVAVAQAWTAQRPLPVLHLPETSSPIRVVEMAGDHRPPKQVGMKCDARKARGKAGCGKSARPV